MSVYAIADLHLSFGVDKSMDIFAGWSDYVKKIEENWRKTVKRNDTVVIAGDISWAMKLEEAKKDLGFVNNLPGNKIIIKGNHDYWWTTKSKIENFLKENSLSTISVLFNCAYRVESIFICGTRGWTCNPESEEDKKILAREAGRLKCSLDFAKKYNLEPVVFLHFPPVYGGCESKEIINLLIERKVKKCYYGHIHGGASPKNIIEGDYKGVYFKMISCDYIDFYPILVV